MDHIFHPIMSSLVFRFAILLHSLIMPHLCLYKTFKDYVSYKKKKKLKKQVLQRKKKEKNKKQTKKNKKTTTQ